MINDKGYLFVHHQICTVCCRSSFEAQDIQSEKPSKAATAELSHLKDEIFRATRPVHQHTGNQLTEFENSMKRLDCSLTTTSPMKFYCSKCIMNGEFSSSDNSSITCSSLERNYRQLIEKKMYSQRMSHRKLLNRMKVVELKRKVEELQQIKSRLEAKKDELNIEGILVQKRIKERKQILKNLNDRRKLQKDHIIPTIKEEKETFVNSKVNSGEKQKKLNELIWKQKLIHLKIISNWFPITISSTSTGWNDLYETSKQMNESVKLSKLQRELSNCSTITYEICRHSLPCLFESLSILSDQLIGPEFSSQNLITDELVIASPSASFRDSRKKSITNNINNQSMSKGYVFLDKENEYYLTTDHQIHNNQNLIEKIRIALYYVALVVQSIIKIFNINLCHKIIPLQFCTESNFTIFVINWQKLNFNIIQLARRCGVLNKTNEQTWNSCCTLINLNRILLNIDQKLIISNSFNNQLNIDKHSDDSGEIIYNCLLTQLRNLVNRKEQNLKRCRRESFTTISLTKESNDEQSNKKETNEIEQQRFITERRIQNRKLVDILTNSSCNSHQNNGTYRSMVNSYCLAPMETEMMESNSSTQSYSDTNDELAFSKLQKYFSQHFTSKMLRTKMDMFNRQQTRFPESILRRFHPYLHFKSQVTTTDLYGCCESWQLYPFYSRYQLFVERERKHNKKYNSQTSDDNEANTSIHILQRLFDMGGYRPSYLIRISQEEELIDDWIPLRPNVNKNNEESDKLRVVAPIPNYDEETFTKEFYNRLSWQ
ncbi:hypothetical protein SNEBB_000054 [Seison nebaliae]|nr:hypothetical protein SNEBB_000054 [Seison nebaliae]